MTRAGYSDTPLSRKLGILEDSLVCALGQHPDLESLFGSRPAGMRLTDRIDAGPDVVLLFTTQRAELEARIEEIARAIHPSASAWICWRKRASKVPTDVTEDVVRAVALPFGLVDNKVAAIDENWSGLRLVRRRELRARTPDTIT